MRGTCGRVSLGDLEQLDGSSSAFREIPEEDPSMIQPRNDPRRMALVALHPRSFRWCELKVKRKRKKKK